MKREIDSKMASFLGEVWESFEMSPQRPSRELVAALNSPERVQARGWQVTEDRLMDALIAVLISRGSGGENFARAKN